MIGIDGACYDAAEARHGPVGAALTVWGLLEMLERVQKPAAYFRSAAILFRAVRFPDMAALASRPQTAGSIRRAFAAVNPGVTAPMIAVTTDRQGWLKEVRLCLGPRMRPQRCKPFQVGAYDARAVRIRPIPKD